MNQCWYIVNWTRRNKLQWNFNRNSKIFIQEIALVSVVCELASIFFGLNVLINRYVIDNYLIECMSGMRRRISWAFLLRLYIIVVCNIKWKHFPRYWPFVRGIQRWPVDSPHKGQRNGVLCLFYVRLNKRLSKQSIYWWFKTPWHPLWRQCNGLVSVRYPYFHGCFTGTIIWLAQYQ